MCPWPTPSARAAMAGASPTRRLPSNATYRTPEEMFSSYQSLVEVAKWAEIDGKPAINNPVIQDRLADHRGACAGPSVGGLLAGGTGAVPRSAGHLPMFNKLSSTTIIAHVMVRLACEVCWGWSPARAAARRQRRRRSHRAVAQTSVLVHQLFHRRRQLQHPAQHHRGKGHWACRADAQGSGDGRGRAGTRARPGAVAGISPKSLREQRRAAS